MSFRSTAFAIALGLCTISAGRAQQAATVPSPAPSPLVKLGLSKVPFGTPLEMFKHAYRRAASAGRSAPYCSDDYPNGAYLRSAVPGVALINCRLHFPDEQTAPEFRPPRVLAFETLLLKDSPVGYDLIFRFLPVEGVARLWRVEGVFSLRDWPAANGTLERHHGKARSERAGPAGTYGAAPEVVQRSWQADGATFTLHRYFGDYLTSALVAQADDLEALFRQRLARTRSETP